MKKNGIIFDIIGILFCLMFFMAFGFYFRYNAISHKPRQVEHYFVEFCSWDVVHDDGTREKLMLPGAANASMDEKLVMEAVLPDNLTDSDWFNLTNSRNLDIYIDGVLRKSFRETDSDIAGGAVKGIKQFCRLTKEDAGKVIRLERDSDITSMSKMYIGDSLGLVSMYLLQGAAVYVSAMVLLLVAIGVTVFGIVLRTLYKTDNPLIALGAGVAVGALWILFDSAMYQFVFDNYYIDGVMGYIMAVLMPFPFLSCINTVEGRRYNRLNAWVAFVLLVNVVTVCGLHFTNTLVFKKTQLASDLVIVACMLVFMSALVTDMIKKRIDNRIQVYGLFAGLVLGAVEVVLINISRNRKDGSLILMGLWVILISAVFQQIVNMVNKERERQRIIHANEAKTEFLAKMSHEIRTPINAVLGMDEMILRECNDPNISQYASDIKVATNNLLSIINEILDSSKIESGKMDIVPAKYHMAILLNDLYNMIYIKSEEKNLKLIFDIDRQIPSEYYGDDVRVKQILVNLLSNAVKYTKEGEVRLTLTEKTVAGKAILKFSVKDTGMGIKEKDIPSLFEAYKRVDEGRNRYVEGTGLGMSITAQLLELMGSKLTVSSVYGKGSEFSFELEQGIENDAPLGNFRESEARHVGPGKLMDFEAPNAKILVVDDNKMNHKVFSLIIKNVKMQITDALSGEECLEFICKQKYDMIFLDHMMPEMDGIEVLEKMKDLKGNLNTDTPIIMFTANAIKGAKEYYQSCGAMNYISKPVKPEELKNMFLEYLDPSLVVRN